MKKLKFNPILFASGDGELVKEVNAEIAQSIFDDWYAENIENAPVVYYIAGIKPEDVADDRLWVRPRAISTHKAKLINIEKIEEGK